jgi:hypothetical protein
MPRQPDAPGTYRVRQRGDGWRVSGVDKLGERLRKEFPDEVSARSFAATTFEGRAPQSVTVDEWGLPVDGLKMAADVAQSINASIGIAPPPSPGTPPPKVETAEEARKKKEQAMMISEMLGIGWASGTVMMGRKITENAGKEPVAPNPKQVNNLADSATETIKGWFGDREIKPWQLTILLSLAIPMTMLIQSRPARKGADQPEPKLKSVP